MLLVAAGVPHVLHPYRHDDRSRDFGEEAAARLQVARHRVLKTLIVDDGEALAVAVLAVAHRLDLKAMAQALGVKRVALADPARATRSTGYVLGGISPLGQRNALPAIVDAPALRFATVYVSAGRRGLQVEVAPRDLLRLTRARAAAIAVGGAA